jgi:hypothetical protein
MELQAFGHCGMGYVKIERLLFSIAFGETSEQACVRAKKNLKKSKNLKNWFGGSYNDNAETYLGDVAAL